MLEVFSLSALTIDAFWSPHYKIVFNFALLCLRMKESNSNFGAGCPNWAVWADLRFGFVHSTDIVEQNQNMFCVWDIIMYQICAAEQN